jgi:hypothetical protein
MASNKIKFTSPAGRAQYPWLKTPDTAFGGEPKYKTNLIVENNCALVAQIEKLASDEFGAKAAKASLPIETDEETGETVLKIKSKYAPAFFDASGANLTGKQIPDIWGGSTIRVGGVITPWTVLGKNGISLQLTRVQVIDLVTKGSGGSVSGDGFDAVEGSFIAEEPLQEDFDHEEEAAPEMETADRF